MNPFKNYLGALALFSMIIGCGSPENKNNALHKQNDTPPDAEELSPTSSNVVYADHWSDITITANYAKTVVDVGAHFITSRNACGKDAYGAIELELWNTISKNANLATSTPPRQEDLCIDPPTDTYKYMDGTVEIKIDDKKETLYEFKGGQICSRIQDPEINKKLIDSINQIIQLADKEDCPNGWGS
jgi:hypothetical protein